MLYHIPERIIVSLSVCRKQEDSCYSWMNNSDTSKLSCKLILARMQPPVSQELFTPFSYSALPADLTEDREGLRNEVAELRGSPRGTLSHTFLLVAYIIRLFCMLKVLLGRAIVWVSGWWCHNNYSQVCVILKTLLVLQEAETRLLTALWSHFQCKVVLLTK